MTEFFREYRPYLVFAAIVAVGFAGLYLASGHYYPIALVDQTPISARRFWENYRSALVYYENAMKTYDPQGTTPAVRPDEIEAGVLTQLIEDSLVHKAVSREVGGELDSLVANKVGKYGSDAQLQRAVETLYGLSFRDFESAILVPQAEKDILAGRLFLINEQLEIWLKNAKQSARVIIFSSRFRWDGERVVAGT